ncbi:DUF1573 domain-containing protein [Halosquirtibacter xylanolyticus]|uniref:DUF1573 domain-containing protein n=1 Tax=Halosquirtibacter xylanolyticus TaxID=3374599 RepID=UPI0037494895|nr:DUF1573 domain-containing protein [Prolixibacteraceae bacterium]
MRWIVSIFFIYLLTQCSSPTPIDSGGTFSGYIGSSQTISIPTEKLSNKFQIELLLENRGRTPIRIYRLISSCGCVDPQWDTKPVVPHQRATITLTITREDQSKLQKRCLIKHSGASAPDTLYIRSQ